jgi:type I restriction enzyme, R subunit
MGTLLEYFKQATSITAEPPIRENKTIIEVIDDVWKNRDRDYNLRCLVKRLQRIDKEMSGEARELFSAHIPGGDLRAYAAGFRYPAYKSCSGSCPRACLEVPEHA